MLLVKKQFFIKVMVLFRYWKEKIQISSQRKVFLIYRIGNKYKKKIVL